jgi:hypothetical protein
MEIHIFMAVKELCDFLGNQGSSIAFDGNEGILSRGISSGSW